MARSSALVAMALAGLVSARMNAASPGEEAFQRLKGLAGDWEAKTPKGSVLRLSYRVVSRDSVLVESWAPGSKGETLTVYHLDGPALLLTHYCAQGNQPRLKLKKAEGSAYEFAFLDATNLGKPGDAHLHRMRLELLDKEHMTKHETYVEDGKEETTSLTFERVR